MQIDGNPESGIDRRSNDIRLRCYAMHQSADLLSTANIAISYTTHQRPSLVSQPELVLRALATPQPDHLPVLLQLRDELIADSDNIVVLFVLVVTSLCLDHTSHAIDHAW